jgi:hypothetical protein
LFVGSSVEVEIEILFTKPWAIQGVKDCRDEGAISRFQFRISTLLRWDGF